LNAGELAADAWKPTGFVSQSLRQQVHVQLASLRPIIITGNNEVKEHNHRLVLI